MEYIADRLTEPLDSKAIISWKKLSTKNQNTLRRAIERSVTWEAEHFQGFNYDLMTKISIRDLQDARYIGPARAEELIKELRAHVAKEIGAIAKPRQIVVVQELPKTRSGKIMRRLLKDVAENRAVGDSTTLADPNVMALISQGLSTAKDED